MRAAEAGAFHDLATAAEWLAVPVDVLRLKDEAAPHIGATSREVFGSHR